MEQSAASVRPPTGVWSTLKEAVRGSNQDLTEAPIGRAVVLLAVPMVLEMFMESVFAVADVFFVGRLGPERDPCEMLPGEPCLGGYHCPYGPFNDIAFLRGGVGIGFLDHFRDFIAWPAPARR